MKNHTFIFMLLTVLFACTTEPEPTSYQINSPGEALTVAFALDTNGQPTYRVLYQDAVIIDTSRLGFAFAEGEPLGPGMEIIEARTSDFSETWEPLWGEVSRIENNYRELRVQLAETAEPGRRMDLVFRAYDDGLGFRYEFPEQEALDSVTIMDENTEFRLTGDHTTWWIPGDWDIYEHFYNTTRFSEIDATAKRDHPNLAQTFIPENAVNTPVTMKTDGGLYLSFHEANLTNYAGMPLKVDTENMGWVSELVGSGAGHKVKTQAPFATPWRTIQVGERAGDLIESHLIVNLNEPNKLGNPGWIRPMKYAGIWWEMHIGKATWDLASGRHAATTENAKRYIDFCAANGIRGLLVEGWNTGWERWIGFEDREGVFDFVTPYEDYDIREVVRYGKEKGVDIIMHHETSAAPRTYEQQLDTAYALMRELGIHAVKTGYVGKIIPAGEYHHGQWMVNHYRKVLETAAEYEVMVDAHEPIKATGIRRTYPNMMTREGLRGQEFNAFSTEGGNPTEHLTIVAFTRMLAGPIDYTPGVFNLAIDPYKENNRVKHTLAHELALYVVIYSPLQMVADLPKHLEGQPGMQWVRDVPVDWDDTRVLNGEVGDYVTIVRKGKGAEDWFLGAITDEEGRELEIDLGFLSEGNYRAVRYEDAADAHWDTKPTAMVIRQETLTADSTLTLNLRPGGGAAIAFFKE